MANTDNEAPKISAPLDRWCWGDLSRPDTTRGSPLFSSLLRPPVVPLPRLDLTDPLPPLRPAAASPRLRHPPPPPATRSPHETASSSTHPLPPSVPALEGCPWRWRPPAGRPPLARWAGTCSARTSRALAPTRLWSCEVTLSRLLLRVQQLRFDTRACVLAGVWPSRLGLSP